VYAIDSILIGTHYRKQFIIRNNRTPGWRDSITEGVGSSNGLLEYIVFGFEFSWDLLCFRENDTTVYPYLNDSCQVFILGTPHIEQENATLTVYPNPSNGVFTVSISNEELVMKNNVEVYNVLGEKVYSQFTINNSQFTIDLSSQYNGIYFYRLISENGDLIGEGKLMIQK
jgi:hypothetical protein